MCLLKHFNDIINHIITVPVVHAWWLNSGSAFKPREPLQLNRQTLLSVTDKRKSLSDTDIFLLIIAFVVICDYTCQWAGVFGWNIIWYCRVEKNRKWKQTQCINLSLKWGMNNSKTFTICTHTFKLKHIITPTIIKVGWGSKTFHSWQT